MWLSVMLSLGALSAVGRSDFGRDERLLRRALEGLLLRHLKGQKVRHLSSRYVLGLSDLETLSQQ